MGLGMRAVALTVAYVLVLQVLMASLLTARMVGEPLHDPSLICLNSPVSTQPSGEGGDGRAVAHCPLCSLRFHVLLPPAPAQGEPPALPDFSLAWQAEVPSLPVIPLPRAAHHPRGPPAASLPA